MFETLTYFCRAYLHQDWDYEYGSLEEAVAAFALPEPQYPVATLIAEIDMVLRRYTTEADLRWLLIERMRSNYLAEADGLTYAQWLKRVRNQLVTYAPATEGVDKTPENNRGK